MAHHDKKVRTVLHPNFGAGRVFDVWFVAEGRNRLREKLCVTTQPETVVTWAFQVLQQRVRERYANGRIEAKGRWSRIDVTDRPEGNKVWSIRFDGRQEGSL